jgi:hypothetical protein
VFGQQVNEDVVVSDLAIIIGDDPVNDLDDVSDFDLYPALLNHLTTTTPTPAMGAWGYSRFIVVSYQHSPTCTATVVKVKAAHRTPGRLDWDRGGRYRTRTCDLLGVSEAL